MSDIEQEGTANVYKLELPELSILGDYPAIQDPNLNSTFQRELYKKLDVRYPQSSSENIQKVIAHVWKLLDPDVQILTMCIVLKIPLHRVEGSIFNPEYNKSIIRGFIARWKDLVKNSPLGLEEDTINRVVGIINTPFIERRMQNMIKTSLTNISLLAGSKTIEDALTDIKRVTSNPKPETSNQLLHIVNRIVEVHTDYPTLKYQIAGELEVIIQSLTILEKLGKLVDANNRRLLDYLSQALKAITQEREQ